MKTLFSLILLFCSTSIFATDLVVESFGIAPAYSDIQSAINAAANGDRILIRSRPGGIPWIQPLSINKNIELLSYDNDTMFYYQGDVTIDVSTATEVTIISMRNTNGDILLTGTGTTKSCKLTLLDSYINGNLDLDNDHLVLECAGSEIRGYIHYSHGNIIGNLVQNGISFIGQTGTYPNEKAKIIGNQCYSQVMIEDGNYNFHIYNNLVDIYRYGYQAAFPVMSFETTGSSAFQNFIYNNSLKWEQQQSRLIYGTVVLSIKTRAGTGHITEIMNNTIYGRYVYNASATTLYGIERDGGNGTVNLYFNHFDLTNRFEPAKVANIRQYYTFTADFSNSNTTTTHSQTTVIDGGNPAPAFYDLDLTPNDAGAYGGSYTLDNFFPLHTGSARVYMIDYPFNVRQGSTLNIEASSFDR